MRIYSFPRGGLPYEDHTAPQRDKIVTAFLPAISLISLGNKVSGKVYPLVNVGDMVKEGMLVARASGTGVVNVHAVVPGRIIRKVSWRDTDGLENEAFLVRMEGVFEKLGKRPEIFSWTGLGCYDLQKIISDYGIMEMENSGRPLAKLISEGRKESDLTLVVRCVFDDPWLAADYALCSERINAVAEGAYITAYACSKVKQIIFAVSHNERELGERLLYESQNWKTISSALVLTGSRYPQRNSRELELALRIYEKKEGLNLGSLLILGPAVLAAAHDAVKHKKPILDRYVAVGGSAVKRPQIMKVRIGTRIGELIEQCGGFVEKPQKIIIGSPLSGREAVYLDEPVGKTCYAIAAMTKTQTALHKQQNCINCGECRAVCPIGLDPQNIYKRIISPETEKAGPTGCQGCGCCKVVCPSALPLSETMLEKNQEAIGA
jgi:electron transport complex protein RnfC